MASPVCIKSATRLESAALGDSKRERIAQRQHYGGGSGRREVERAGFLVHRAIQADVAGAAER